MLIHAMTELAISFVSLGKCLEDGYCIISPPAVKASCSISCLCPTSLTHCVLPADIIRVIPSKAVELAAFDIFKGMLASTNEETGKVSRPGALLTGLAGAAAGLSLALPKSKTRVLLCRAGLAGRHSCRLVCSSPGRAECAKEQSLVRRS